LGGCLHCETRMETGDPLGELELARAETLAQAGAEGLRT
jgi:hypothetical protein